MALGMPSDLKRALMQAARNPDPWRRAQVLSDLAERAPEPFLEKVLRGAVVAAYEGRDAYKIVAAMSWPLEVALKRGRISFAALERDKILQIAPTVEPRASRAFALQLLWGGCYAGGERFVEPIWRAILRLCNPDHNWREAQLYRHIAEVKESHRPGAAAEVIAAMPVGKTRAKLERRFGCV
jgi:hypothetical protein